MTLAMGGASRSPSTSELVAELRTQLEVCRDDAAVLRAFRRFRRGQTLRIGANDIIRDRPLEEITRDLARVADAAVAAAVAYSLRNLGKKFGQPTTADDRPARLAVLAFGKLGGEELNYSSDIDLMFVYDDDGETTGRRCRCRTPSSSPASSPKSSACSRRHTDRGLAYRVDLRLRPEGQRGPLARSLASTLRTTTRWAAPGSGRRSSSSAPSPATAHLGSEFLAGDRAVRLPQVFQLRARSTRSRR